MPQVETCNWQQSRERKKTQAGRIQHCQVARVGGNSAKDIRSSSAAVNYVWNLIWHLISDLIVCKNKMCTILLKWKWKQTSQQSFYVAQGNSIEHKIIMIYYILCAKASGLSWNRTLLLYVALIQLIWTLLKSLLTSPKRKLTGTRMRITFHTHTHSQETSIN